MPQHLNNLHNQPDCALGMYDALRQFLFEKTPASFETYGISMVPTLFPGNAVSVVPATGALHPGACYIFYYNKKLCCHRLVQKKNNRAWFIGDAEQSFESVDLQAVVGFVPLREGRFKLLFLQYINYLCLELYRYHWYRQVYFLFSIKRFVLNLNNFKRHLS